MLAITASAPRAEGSASRVQESSVAVVHVRRMLSLRSERFGATRWSLERPSRVTERQRGEIRDLFSEMLASAVWEG